MAAVLEDSDEREPSVHVEEQIYDSFTGAEDQAVMAAFHEAENGPTASRCWAVSQTPDYRCWGSGCCTRRRQK